MARLRGVESEGEMKSVTMEELNRFESGDIEKAKEMVCEVSKDPCNRRLTVPPERDDFDMLLTRVIVHTEKLEAERDALKKQVEELEDYQEKLLCENEIHEQCIANIIDTKPGGSIEGQMIAATQMCVRAEQREEKLMKKLTALGNDARLVVGILKERVSRNALDDDEVVVVDRILAATEGD